MEENKDKLPDETSKGDEKDNVNPQGNSTSDSNPSETSKDDDKSKDEVKVQQAIQKHAELREKAEKEAEEARKRAEEAEKQRSELAQQLESTKKANLEASIKARIEKSNLPAGFKQRIAKEPVKWVTIYAEDAPQSNNVDELIKFVSEKLEDVVQIWEKESGVTASPRTTFVDSDNASISTPVKMPSASDLKKMTPYQIQDLMRNNPQLKEKLLTGEINSN